MGKGPDKRTFEELLAGLKALPSLAPYSLTLYCRKPSRSEFENCCSVVEDALCRDVARQFFEPNMEVYFQEGTTSVCRYGGGFFGFVIPFSIGSEEFCLVGDGVRDDSIDLWQLAALARSGGGEVFSLFPYVESLCTASLAEVEQVAQELAREVTQRVEKFSCTPSYSAPLPSSAELGEDECDPRLRAVARSLEELDHANTVTETVGLCCEALVTHFNAPKTAIALRDASGSSYEVSGVWGLPDELGSIPADAIHLFTAKDRQAKTVIYDAQMREVLPAVQATVCTCFPLRCQDERLGFVALFDAAPSKNTSLLISMLASATAAKLSRILKDAEQSKENALSQRLMSLTNTLLQVDSKDELYQAILEIAAELIDASQGSVMLIDKDGQNMHIVFTLGMTLNIARCLPVKVGKGIAGMVAQSGQPLLVNDVEKDSRVAMANRLRFKSKSLICMPLKLKDKIIGVLNLSDKKNLAPFTDADLQVLTSFANLASLMIERTEVLEESERFEQLSVTDALTGLYNRRFLKNRLEEELNRSIRQGLNLTVIFIDLDFFKSYNDLCGHLAGDEALRITAEIIKASLREMDIVARYGGEEFCAVLPGTSKVEAMIVAERIRSEIEREIFPGESEIPQVRLTASLGVSSFPEDGRTFTALVHASDVALYEAKASGRNRIVAARTSPGQKDMPAPAPPSGMAKTLDFNAYLEASVGAKG
ncbi:diguanylate cyclase [Geoanaerobacter pelophilus]|uniref:diguanylate cyclase n=1 Tax=Geoanaerobacter pelophilus TaxID=60036 RepID=A0ABQ0MJX4_9BACT|nr:sensor domain-containing diguanylate cyclase [Geoanaerobacter pelophilus]GAW66466.1 diguanylate cyclase [Geoanaerobacter pelophilus]